MLALAPARTLANHEISFTKTHGKNMATLNEPRKKRAKLGYRYSMELNFASEDAKVSFMSRMESAKARFAPRGSPSLDNRDLLSSLRDMAEATPSNQPTGSGDQLQSQAVPRPIRPVTMLDNSGLHDSCIYIA